MPTSTSPVGYARRRSRRAMGAARRRILVRRETARIGPVSSRSCVPAGNERSPRQETCRTAVWRVTIRGLIRTWIHRASAPAIAGTEAATVTSTEPPAAPTRVLAGKRAAVLLFAYYPADARPRRAAEALVAEGMHVELICL